MIHLYQTSGSAYALDTVRTDARWVLGHTCPLRDLAPADPEPTKRNPCTCGHSDMKVHAWPAPAGEGVEVQVECGEPLVRDGECDGDHDGPWCGNCGTTMEAWRPLDERPEDAPIRDAWERLCDHQSYLYSATSHEPETPTDGLYLFHDGEILRLVDVTEAWRRTMPEEADVLRATKAALQITGAQALRFSAPGKEPVWIDRARVEGRG